jgi:anti-sigma B factor antagonist
MASEKMQISASQGARDGQKILSLNGPLTIQTTFDFQNAARAETSPALIIDLSGVPFVDSAGLGALVGTHVTAQRANREIAFVGVNSRVKALMDMTHVSQLFRMYPTVQDAEASLISKQS